MTTGVSNKMFENFGVKLSLEREHLPSTVTSLKYQSVLLQSLNTTDATILGFNT
jgi:hypothetical protein